MDHLDIEGLKQKLELQRQEILLFLRRVEQETQSLAVDSTQDSADLCVISVQKESLFERNSQRRARLCLVEVALQRIADGMFGTCVTCGDDIQPRRLEALPWTQFCLRCQEAIEEEADASLSARAPTPAAAVLRRAG